MWQRRLVSVVIMLGTFFAISAAAQDDETTADTRCVIVGWNLSKSPDHAVRTASAILAIYYIGRLEGRNPKLELENRILDEMFKLSLADIQAESRRCGDAMTTKGRFISEMGENLTKRRF